MLSQWGWLSGGLRLTWTGWPPSGLATFPTPLSLRWATISTCPAFQNSSLSNCLFFPGFGASLREVRRCGRHLLAHREGHWQVWLSCYDTFQLCRPTLPLVGLEALPLFGSMTSTMLRWVYDEWNWFTVGKIFFSKCCGLASSWRDIRDLDNENNMLPIRTCTMLWQFA